MPEDEGEGGEGRKEEKGDCVLMMEVNRLLDSRVGLKVGHTCEDTPSIMRCGKSMLKNYHVNVRMTIV